MVQKFLDAAQGVASSDLSSVTPATQLGDLPIDSLDLYTVIENLEDMTGLTLEDEAFGQMETVGDLLAFFGGPIT